tara:strand:+ start:489 stop:686 length:198 start_codon:yes stop_codon:yes gene_type:complete
MQINVNGKPTEVKETNLCNILKELGYYDAKVATAVNEVFVPTADRSKLKLSAGDRLEIVAPQQGG